MKEWVRRQIDQLCNHLQNTLGTVELSDDIPQPLSYGQTGSPGTSTKASRSDHRHALDAAIFGVVPTVVLDLNTNSSTQNTQLKLLQNIFGSNTGLISDAPGTAGAFGMSGLNYAVGSVPASSSYHIAISNFNPGSGTGNTTDRVHSPQRMAIIVMRVLTRSTTIPNNIAVAIGGIHETANADIDTIDDALCFYIEVDNSGIGNFRALAKSSTTGGTTDIDLGFTWPALASGQFQNFVITYDLTTASFIVDDVLYAQITTNIPTAKLFGWGIFAEKRVNTPSSRETWLDDILFLGRF